MKHRIFIVGCSRSGTTLLQRLMTENTGAITFPETNYFRRTVGKSTFWPRLGLATGRERRALSEVCGRLKREDSQPDLRGPIWTFKRGVDAYLRILDGIAAEQGADSWIEKTPHHIFYVGLIHRFVANDRVIHIVRDGREVVASIYDRARRFPVTFENQTSVDYGIKLWNSTVRESAQFVGQPGNVFVSYERLVETPVDQVDRICRAARLEFRPYGAKPLRKDAYMHSAEEWKAQSASRVFTDRRKFERLFSREQQHTIEDRLNWLPYQTVVGAAV
ncbi:MAG: sulfotransferase [Nitrospirota bacterium]|jgi:hypothetical protein